MKYLIWIVVIAAVAAGGYYWWKQQNPEVPPAAAAPAPAVATEPEIAHPLNSPETADAALPPLTDSDAAAQDALKGLVGDSLDLFYLKDIIRHIVATIDNLPREKLAQRLMPIKPVPGSFIANTSTYAPETSAANAKRYAPYVHAVDAVDAHQLVAVYLHFYPLFQQAYHDLGYPKGYFNDRLIVTIDNLLATPVITQPIKLQRPEALYQFADPELEARSAGQKILLRMGNDNAAIVKKKLQEIRNELIASEKKPDAGQ